MCHGSQLWKQLDRRGGPATDMYHSVTDWQGNVIKENGQRIHDTKRYLRANDIAGSIPKEQNSVTINERDFARTNYPIIDAFEVSRLGQKRRMQ